MVQPLGAEPSGGRPGGGIRSPDLAERIKAVQALEHIGAEDTEVAIPALVVGLSDPDAAVRISAAKAMVTIINGAMTTDSVPAISARP